jgi:hypothetical protein
MFCLAGTVNDLAAARVVEGHGIESANAWFAPPCGKVNNRISANCVSKNSTANILANFGTDFLFISSSLFVVDG